MISVFLFAGFAVLAFTGLFDLVEARFYNPSIVKSLNREIEEDARTIENFLAELEGRFSEALREDAVRRSFLPNQSAEDIFERSRRFGVLMETLGGLQSIRFVDEGGLRIHYSTRPQDILNQDRLSVAYRNYDTIPGVLPYDQVAVPALGGVKYTLDGTGDRIILSFPFYDSFEVYRGTALFSLSARAAAERLIGTGRIKAGDDVSIIQEPAGIVTGVPRSAEGAVLSAVASIWDDGIVSLTPLKSAESGATLALISFRTDQSILVGRLVDETLFVFPNTMKTILLTAFFLTIYLVIFLFFNLRQDTMTIVQDRLKNLQISLIEQYYDRKGDVDWNHWSRELEQRREDIRIEVKRGIKTKKGQRAEEDIDSLIDKSWDELLTVIGNRRQSSGIDEEKLQSILNHILRTVPGLPAAGSAAAGVPAGPALTAAPARTPAEEEVEELDELAEEPEEAEVVEELEELAEEPEEAEAVEEPEELAEEPEEAEAVEEPEELAEEPEAAEELAAEPEEAETVEEPEELAEEPEEPEEAEELAAEPEEAEAVEEPEELAEEPKAAEESGADGEAEELAAEPEEAEAVEELEELAEETEEAASSGSGLLAAADRKKSSNIKLAFGDDNIPYIVETSGLELVDEDVDLILNDAQADDEPAVLEELDEEDAGGPDGAGEPEELEELEEVEETANQKGLSPLDINNIASQIEFSDTIKTKDGDGSLNEDLEIISPFTTMLSDIAPEKTDTADEEPPEPSAKKAPHKTGRNAGTDEKKKPLNRKKKKKNK
ncbi:MAG: hypothetical protein LBS06_03935 [Treponema sp.]|nr:hypothetical protein [Treponema sp.]